MYDGSRIFLCRRAALSFQRAVPWPCSSNPCATCSSEQAPLPKHDVKTTPVPGFPTEGSSATGGHPLVVSLLYVLEPIQPRGRFVHLLRSPTSVARTIAVLYSKTPCGVSPNFPTVSKCTRNCVVYYFNLVGCLWHQESCSRATPRALSDEAALLRAMSCHVTSRHVALPVIA